MRGLVIGGGSIGVRHLRNLQGLGVEQLGLVEPDAARRSSLVQTPLIVGFATVEAGLDWQPEFIVIATPTHLHVTPALMAAHCGADLFIEKPLSHAAEHLEELAELTRRKRLVSLVGCNMRFHPGPVYIKQLLDDGRLGKILFCRIQVGSYLPEWRQGQDYRQNYAAKIETGGGCILDCIHEIDLARWYLGKVSRVFCCAGHKSSLEIETEDVAALICQHQSGTVSEIHLDYVQRIYQRDCQIVGEQGSVFWDVHQGSVRYFDAATKQWATHHQPETWCVNDMYMAEMKHFLDCVIGRKTTALPIPEAVDLMRVVFAAKVSAQTGDFVRAEEEPVCS